FPNSDNPFPFEIIPCWVVDNDDFMPESDISQAAQRQRSFDEALMQLETKRSKSPDMLLAPDSIFQGENGEANRKAIEDGKPNQIIRVPQGMGQFIQWLSRPPMNMEMYKELDTAPSDIKQLIGVSDYQMLDAPNREMKVIEVAALQQQGGTRQSADMDAYNRFKERIAYKVLVLMQIFGNRERQYSFTAKDGAQQCGAVVPMVDLRGSSQGEPSSGELLERPGIQWRVQVSASQSARRNRLLDRQEKLRLLEILTPFLETPDPDSPGSPLIDRAALLRSVLETFDLPNMGEIVRRV
ncbi:MAG TPA: hypothetical protein VHS28_06170, partial [Chloroflexota bacterium]|nr:hypothetical protein [Chloroflexota bacterium]